MPIYNIVSLLSGYGTVCSQTHLSQVYPTGGFLHSFTLFKAKGRANARPSISALPRRDSYGQHFFAFAGAFAPIGASLSCIISTFWFGHLR